MMRLIGSKTLSFIAISLLIFQSCTRSYEIEPRVYYSLEGSYLKNLSSPFTPLSPSEAKSPWGIEHQIGVHFAKALDFYRAITAFERSRILAPKDKKERLGQIDYEILLCYYLGKQYKQVDKVFSQTPLAYVGADFPAYLDLLVILYDTYLKCDQTHRAMQILNLIQAQDLSLCRNLAIGSAFENGDLSSLETFAQGFDDRPYLDEFVDCYCANKKSEATASRLNAILPGAGYLYLGQKQTAITAFLFNGLFIASSIYFFKNGPLAAGIITTSFEAGWYFGGIVGAANEAKLYNERLYEQLATPLMNQEKLFPIFQINYAF